MGVRRWGCDEGGSAGEGVTSVADLCSHYTLTIQSVVECVGV